MSVVVIMKVPGDTSKFRKFFEDNAEMIGQISEGAQAQGCSHHVFAEGENVITTVDTWTSRAAFEKFFSAPEIAETMANAGASGPPAIEFYEVLESLDSF
jgi:heme-degrading monooxygenase HmoA